MQQDYIKTLSEVGVDVEEGTRRFSGNEALFQKFLVKFLDDDNYMKTEAAIRDNDYEAVQAGAHTLKGVAGNLAMKTLFNASNELMMAVREQDFEKCDEIFAVVRQSYISICEAIKTGNLS